MQDPKTTRAALVAVVSFAVMAIARRFHLELPPEVRDGIVVLIMSYGLYRAADARP
jgi:hypothetical protein